MSDNDIKFYFKISAILAFSFVIWLFSSPEKKEVSISTDQVEKYIKSPASILNNFTPPQLVVFDDSPNILPKRNWSEPFLELQADAALAANSDLTRTYFNKNIEMRRPIASLTKLMTAIIVLENYNLDDIISVPESAVKREGAAGDLVVSELLTVRSLLNIMLIDSSNDAALALADKNPNFIFMMNEKAKELGLENTRFANPDGLDDDGHYSSAIDIAKLFIYFMKRYPQEFEILKTKNMVVYSTSGNIEHRLKNTNELLGQMPEVKAGKTGYTEKAGGSLALLISYLSFENKNDVITVVLGSPDRFGESEKLINWLRRAYVW